MAIKSITLKGLTFEETRQKILEKIPSGCVLISEKILENGTPKQIIEIAQSANLALKNAKLKVPTNSKVIKEEVFEKEEEKNIDLKLWDNEDVKSKLNQAISFDAEIIDQKLTKGSKKGFLGIGKKPNVYQIIYKSPAKVSVSYQPQVEIEIEYGSKSDKEKIQRANIEKANQIFQEANSLFTNKQSHSMKDYDSLLKISEMYTRAIDLDPSQSRFYNNRGFMNYQITLILLPHVSQEGRIGFFCKNNDSFKEIKNETGLLSDDVRKLLNECIDISLRDFTKAVELKPEDGVARTSLANVLFDLGRFSDAQRELETAELKAKHPETVNRINSDLERIKKFIKFEHSTKIVNKLKELKTAINELPSLYPSNSEIPDFIMHLKDSIKDQIPIITDNIEAAIQAINSGYDTNKNPISTDDIAYGLQKLINELQKKEAWEQLMQYNMSKKGLNLLKKYLKNLNDIAVDIYKI